jgi:hypothetical protein
VIARIEGKSKVLRYIFGYDQLSSLIVSQGNSLFDMSNITYYIYYY